MPTYRAIINGDGIVLAMGYGEGNQVCLICLKKKVK